MGALVWHRRRGIPQMNPYRKAALLLIRLVAFGFVMFGGLQAGLYFLMQKSGRKIEDGAVLMALKTLPLLIGLVLLIKSYAIAKRLTEDFEE